MKKLYVSARWSDYQNLDSRTGTAVHGTAEEANTNCHSNQDKILKFAEEEQAAEYVQAMKFLCDAAWTPNQTEDEKEENGKVIADAQAVIDRLESSVVETLNPWEDGE